MLHTRLVIPFRFLRVWIYPTLFQLNTHRSPAPNTSLYYCHFLNKFWNEIDKSLHSCIFIDSNFYLFFKCTVSPTKSAFLIQHITITSQSLFIPITLHGIIGKSTRTLFSFSGPWKTAHFIQGNYFPHIFSLIIVQVQPLIWLSFF